jgi:PhnB protein
MQINPYLNFQGDCEEAFRFYARLLRGTIDPMHRFEGTPAGDHVPAEFRNKIMHVRLTAGAAVLMGSDAPPGRYERPQGTSVSLNVADPKDADRIFAGLADNGTVAMPIQETFWALRFGMCTDRYGIPWMVNCDRPQQTSA